MFNLQYLQDIICLIYKLSYGLSWLNILILTNTLTMQNANTAFRNILSNRPITLIRNNYNVDSAKHFTNFLN